MDAGRETVPLVCVPDRKEDGWWAEVAVPWKELGVGEPVPWMGCGLQVMVKDVDFRAGRYSKKLFAWTPPPAHSGQLLLLP